MNKKWDQRFFRIAQTVAKRSKDPSTKVGAVIVSSDKHIISRGWNGFPTKVKDLEKRWQRPEKYFWTEHAERNAIYQAARRGASLQGSILYTTLFTCAECARAVIQSGIICVVSPVITKTDKIWSESWEKSKEMYKESGIELKWIEKELKGI